MLLKSSFDVQCRPTNSYRAGPNCPKICTYHVVGDKNVASKAQHTRRCTEMQSTVNARPQNSEISGAYHRA